MAGDWFHNRCGGVINVEVSNPDPTEAPLRGACVECGEIVEDDCMMATSYENATEFFPEFDNDRDRESARWG